MMIAVVGDYSIVAEFSKKSVYIFASVIAVVGFVMQDVVADTMSTEEWHITQTQRFNRCQ
jgi:hypothetical protein